MDPILVDSAQLRALQLPGINLAAGRVIVARVLELEAGGRGMLAIAGARIAASLPSGVHPGDELRLVVRDVTPERLVLGLEPPAQPREPSVEERGRERKDRGDASQSIALRYETTTLGPMDLRFELYPGGALQVTVGLDGEAARSRAQEHAGELQAALTRALGTDVGVRVAGPRPPLDVYV